MLRILILFIIPIFLYCSQIKPRHILLLNSYNQSMSWVQDITKSVYDVLEPEQNNLVIHIENMDTKRIYNKKHLEQLKQTYKNKYSEVQFDLILSSDNNAFDFLKENRDELFGNIPVVFAGVNFFKDSDLDGYANYTGITEEFDAIGTLETALKLKPNTKEIFIINDYLKSGVAWRKTIQEQLKGFNKKIKIRYSKNSTISALKAELESLSKDTIVLLGVYFKDVDGLYFTFEKIGEIISTHTKVPLFCLLELNLNKGAVGGNVISGYYQGDVMSTIAKKVLTGVKISSLPVQKKGTTKSIFDYKELQKHKMDIRVLPKDSLIINRHSNKLEFTKKEKEYLKQKKEITVCIDPDWMPFEKFDNKGKHIGLSRDYFEIFQKNIGIPLNVIKTTSWRESISFTKMRKCDVLSLVMPTPKRKEYLSFTSPYINIPLVLATKMDVAFIDNFKQLSHKKIGIVYGYAFNEIIRNKYPSIEVVNVKNTKEGLQKVANGKFFGFVGSIADIGYVSQKSFIGEIKIAGKFDEKWDLGVAVRNDEPLLLEIFEKNIQHLTEDIKQKILNKHIAITYEKGTNYTLFLEVLGLFFILFLAFLYRHIILKKSNTALIAAVEDKTKKLQELNENLEKKVEIRTHQLSLKAHRITYLLDNAAQGFLSFDKDFLIEYEYSVECEKLLGKELHNKDIAMLLFVKSPDKMKFFKETMLDAYNATNELTASLILSLLPKELIVNKRAVQVEYKILSNFKFMLILTNITDKKKLQTKIKNEQSILKMIVSIVSDSILFYETKENFEQFCMDYSIYINPSKSSSDNANALYILVHTFKGLFAQLYMRGSVKRLHDFESLLLEFIDNEINDNEELKKLIVLVDLNSFMDKDLEVLINTLGEKFLEEHSYIKIDEEAILNLENKLSQFCFSSKQKKACEDIIHDLRKLKNKSLKHYLSVYPRLCQQLCLSLDKSIQPFEVIGNDNILVPDSFKPFINSLVHVFRNSCDHGIETREERVFLNKNETGIISCSIEKKDGCFTIEISDDGYGINTKRIKEKAIDKGLIEEDKSNLFSKEQLLNLIFDTHFSTNETLSEISGRGVGLAAVKGELNKLNGSIEVKTQINKGTVFIFKLPLE